MPRREIPIDWCEQFLYDKPSNMNEIFNSWISAGVPPEKCLQDYEDFSSGKLLKPCLILEAKPWHRLAFKLGGGLLSFYVNPGSSKRTETTVCRYLQRFFIGKSKTFFDALKNPTNKHIEFKECKKGPDFERLYTNFIFPAKDKHRFYCSSIHSSCLRYKSGKAGRRDPYATTKHPAIAYGYGDISIFAITYKGETIARTLFFRGSESKKFSRPYFFGVSNAEAVGVLNTLELYMQSIGFSSKGEDALEGARLKKIRTRKTNKLRYSSIKGNKMYVCPYVDGIRSVSIKKDHILIAGNGAHFPGPEGVIAEVFALCYRCNKPLTEDNYTVDDCYGPVCPTCKEIWRVR